MNPPPLPPRADVCLPAGVAARRLPAAGEGHATDAGMNYAHRLSQEDRDAGEGGAQAPETGPRTW